MASEKQIRGKYSNFHYRVWIHLRDFGMMSIDQIMVYVKPGTTDMHTRHRQRVTNALSDMKKNGDIVRVTRGRYAAFMRQVPGECQNVTFADHLKTYVKERGRVQFKQIVGRFPRKTEKAVRSALDRLRAKGIVIKDGQTWCWAGNIVQLDKKRQELQATDPS